MSQFFHSALLESFNFGNFGSFHALDPQIPTFSDFIVSTTNVLTKNRSLLTSNKKKVKITILG